MSFFSKLCTIFLLLVFFTIESKCADAPCGSDWESYKDEKCFKIADETLRTFDEAEKYCPSYIDSDSTLVMIHSKDEQDFLTNYLIKTHKNVENFWIGAKFSKNKFHWIDNLDLNGYSNWDSKAQRKKENYCVEMQADEASIGKWLDEPCVKKNLVVCQKMQTWSATHVQRTLISIRKELTDSREKNILPIGFIYAQLPAEKSPTEIWPWMVWSDVSSTYAGIFFRVTGGDAAAIGQIQEDNAPHINEVNTVLDSSAPQVRSSAKDNSTIGRGAWSLWSFSGIDGVSGGINTYKRYFLSGGEVRPRNMAMRIWRRTG